MEKILRCGISLGVVGWVFVKCRCELDTPVTIRGNLKKED